MTRGDAVIDPIILGSTGSGDEGTALNRMAVRARIDLVRKRMTWTKAISAASTRGRCVMSASRSPEAWIIRANRIGLRRRRHPHADIRDEGCGQSSRPAMCGLGWKIIFRRHRRARRDRAMRRSSTSKNSGPPTPRDGLSIDIETSGTSLRPIDNLPMIRRCRSDHPVTGRSATVSLGRGTVEAGGRKLNISSGVFEVPDTHPKPAPARATFRVDGTMAAAAALLATDGLRDNVGITLDPASSRGTIAAQVTVNVPLAKTIAKGAATYSVTADLTNFAADKMLLGQKLEAAALRVTAGPDGYQVKGDVKINGTAATIDLRKQKGDVDAELRMQANVDEAARRRIGMDLGSAVVGVIPIKVVGRVGDNTTEDRLNVESDLTPVKIDNLLPGWVKRRASRRARHQTDGGRQARRSDHRRFGRVGEGLGRNRQQRRSGFGEFSGIQPVGWRQDVAESRPRNDNVARHDARRFMTAVNSSRRRSRRGHKEKRNNRSRSRYQARHGCGRGETCAASTSSRRAQRPHPDVLTAEIGRARSDRRFARARAYHKSSISRPTTPVLFHGYVSAHVRRGCGGTGPPTQDEAPESATCFSAASSSAASRRSIASCRRARRRKGIVEFSELGVDFTKISGRMSIRDGVVRGQVVRHH